MDITIFSFNFGFISKLPNWSFYFHLIFVLYHIMHSKPITFFKRFLIFSWWILKLPSCKQAQYAITIQVDIDTSHGLNSEFFFLSDGLLSKAKEPTVLWHLDPSWRKKDGYMPFSRSLVLNKHNLTQNIN